MAPGSGCRGCRAREAASRPRCCWRWAWSRCRWPPRSTRSAPWWTTATGTRSALASAGRSTGTTQYGPLDWPRTARRCCTRSRPAALLEDGGARQLRRLPLVALGPRRQGSTRRGLRDGERGIGAARRWDYFEHNPRWDEEIAFTVRSLRAHRGRRRHTTRWTAGSRRPRRRDSGVLGEGRSRRGTPTRSAALCPDPSARQSSRLRAATRRSYEDYTASTSRVRARARPRTAAEHQLRRRAPGPEP